jgi:hypothetical protein
MQSITLSSQVTLTNNVAKILLVDYKCLVAEQVFKFENPVTNCTILITAMDGTEIDKLQFSVGDYPNKTVLFFNGDPKNQEVIKINNYVKVKLTAIFEGSKNETIKFDYRLSNPHTGAENQKDIIATRSIL